jgi:hypothetical protein
MPRTSPSHLSCRKGCANVGVCAQAAPKSRGVGPFRGARPALFSRLCATRRHGHKLTGPGSGSQETPFVYRNQCLPSALANYHGANLPAIYQPSASHRGSEKGNQAPRVRSQPGDPGALFSCSGLLIYRRSVLDDPRLALPRSPLPRVELLIREF